MTGFYLGAAAFILLTMGVGLARVFRGPRSSDRLMAAQLIGSGGAAILLLLSAALEAPSVIDVALMLAILAVFATVGFVNWGEAGDDPRG